MNAGTARKTLACAAGTALLAFSLWGCATSSATATDGGQGITVTASSEVKVVPDKARMEIAVVNEGQTAEACRDDNAEAVDSVLEALAGLNVDETSIQTSYSNLSPRYGSRDDDDWVIIGYEMTTELSIGDLDIDSVGSVIQKCVAAGANRTNGIEYYASGYDDAYNDALEEALETAQAKADGIAKATGVSLGKVISVQEGYQDTSSRYVASYNDGFASAEEADMAAVSKTMPGQIGISANVTVSYAIA